MKRRFYTVSTRVEGTATLGSDRSADPGAGMTGRPTSRPVPHSSWPKSVKSREREGRALALGQAEFLVSGGGGGFGPPTARPAFENVAVMQEAVQHGPDRRGVAEQFAPVFHHPIRSEECVLARS